MDIKLLEAELLKLSPKEKATITYKLLDSLEGEDAGDIEKIWLTEALTRYKQITKDGKHIIDGNLVIKEAKSKYK